MLLASTVVFARPVVWPEEVSAQLFYPDGGAGSFHYYVYEPRKGQTVTRVVLVMHGYPHDVANTLLAAANAAKAEPEAQGLAIVAPLFMVTAAEQKKCSDEGTPRA